MRRPALIALLALAFAAAGCGAASESDQSVDTQEQEQDAAPIAASQVVERFLDSEEGAQLEEAADTDAAWEQLGLGLDATPAEQKRFGTFSIYVVRPARLQAVDSLLTDKETLAPLDEGEDGIYWDYDELASSYVAHKRYGPNVVLAWWNERPEPGTDSRFERLDRLMQQVLAG